MYTAEHVEQLFTLAERNIKRSEILSTELSVPAINQLRYAGHHLSKYISESDEDKRNEELSRAAQHCQKAIRDSYEISVLYLLEQISSFRSEYSSLTKNKKFDGDEISRLFAQAQEAKQILLEDPKDTAGLESLINKYETVLEQLEETHKRLFIMHPILNERESRRRLDRLNSLKNYSAIIVGIVSLAVAVFSIIGGW